MNFWVHPASKISWRCWGVTCVALRIVMDIHVCGQLSINVIFCGRCSTWQGQFLVMLEGGFCSSAHCTGRFMCEEEKA